MSQFTSSPAASSSKPSHLDAYQALTTMLSVLPNANCLTQPEDIYEVLRSLSQAAPNEDANECNRPSAASYHPQPTRSGRTACQPQPEELAAWDALENYVVFPSDSESDDDDFRPTPAEKKDDEAASSESGDYVLDSDDEGDNVEFEDEGFIDPALAQLREGAKATVQRSSARVAAMPTPSAPSATRLTSNAAGVKRKAPPVTKPATPNPIEESVPAEKKQATEKQTAPANLTIKRSGTGKRAASKATEERRSKKLTPDERKQRKAARNKVFAEQSRARAKAHLADLEEKATEIPSLEQRIRDLEAEVKRLRETNEALLSGRDFPRTSGNMNDLNFSGAPVDLAPFITLLANVATPNV